MLNQQTRLVLKLVCNRDITAAQKQTRILLQSCLGNKQDAAFATLLLAELDKQTSLEVPPNLQSLLIVEDPLDFPTERFLLRSEEEGVVERIISLFHASEQLQALRIPYLPSLLLYGPSGCGKTMLARYIAHKANLPFIYVRFSALVDQYLGSTQKNLSRIFEFIRRAPCVLCLDEIDAIGLNRGQSSDVGEMARIVIALMQELDLTKGNAIIIGTTNRYEDLDKALVRRFPEQYEVQPYTSQQAKQLAEMFFKLCGVDIEVGIDALANMHFTPGGGGLTGATVVKYCTEQIVKKILNGEVTIPTESNLKDV